MSYLFFKRFYFLTKGLWEFVCTSNLLKLVSKSLFSWNKQLFFYILKEGIFSIKTSISLSKSDLSLKSYCNLVLVISWQCHSIFPNLVHFWAQKVDYLKNYITYEGKILEGLYLWFFGSEKKIVKIYLIVKKLLIPYKNLSEMLPFSSLMIIYIHNIIIRELSCNKCVTHKLENKVIWKIIFYLIYL